MLSKRLFLMAALTALSASPYARSERLSGTSYQTGGGYAPASGADVVARLIANKLSESLKQNVFVENKPGAGGVIAAQEFVRGARGRLHAAACGYAAVDHQLRG